jgi:hypothetical protein
MKRRFIKLQESVLRTLTVLFAGLAAMNGCNHTAPKETRLVMVFIDVSLSTLPDRENYKKYIDLIVSRLEAGDRLMVSKILDLTIAEFEPIYDAKFPAFNMFSDNRTRYDKTISVMSAQIMATVDSVLDMRSKVQKSEIVNSFLICDQVMRGWPGKKSVVIISDMQESSSEFNFDTDHVTPAYLKNVLATLKIKNRVPRLHGVEVWIAGAYAKDTEQFFAVQGFWTRYVAETGAELRSYSHTLLDFE